MISLRLRMGRDGWLKIGCVFLYPFICPFRGLKGVQKGSGRAVPQIPVDFGVLKFFLRFE